MKRKAIIMARCSTNENRQDVTRQTSELMEKYNSVYDIGDIISYYISGKDSSGKNMEVLQKAIELGAEVIIVSEISRVSRRIKGVIDFVHDCTQNQISVLIDDKSLETLNSDGSENEITKMILSFGAILPRWKCHKPYVDSNQVGKRI